jgi:hypothetical protein
MISPPVKMIWYTVKISEDEMSYLSEIIYQKTAWHIPHLMNFIQFVCYFQYIVLKMPFGPRVRCGWPRHNYSLFLLRQRVETKPDGCILRVDGVISLSLCLFTALSFRESIPLALVKWFDSVLSTACCFDKNDQSRHKARWGAGNQTENQTSICTNQTSKSPEVRRVCPFMLQRKN